MSEVNDNIKGTSLEEFRNLKEKEREKYIWMRGHTYYRALKNKSETGNQEYELL